MYTVSLFLAATNTMKESCQVFRGWLTRHQHPTSWLSFQLFFFNFLGGEEVSYFWYNFTVTGKKTVKEHPFTLHLDSLVHVKSVSKNQLISHITYSFTT